MPLAQLFTRMACVPALVLALSAPAQAEDTIRADIAADMPGLMDI